MKPPPFAYHAPSSLQHALAHLAALDNAKLLAGGQSLMPMLNMRYVQPDHVIDLNTIDGLAYIRAEGDRVAIGGMTRQRDIELDPIVRARLPIIAEALHLVGHVQTRNRGTIGGSLCHLDPAAELPTVATALDAEVIAASPRGRRTIPMAEFSAAYMTPALEPDEIVVEVRFSPWPEGHGFAFEEFARRHGDFALASAAILLDKGPGVAIRRASITVAGLAAAPTRLAAAESLLLGRRLDRALIAQAAEEARGLDAITDVHGSQEYRQHLAVVLTTRALLRAAGLPPR